MSGFDETQARKMVKEIGIEHIDSDKLMILFNYLLDQISVLNKKVEELRTQVSPSQPDGPGIDPTRTLFGGEQVPGGSGPDSFSVL